MKVCVKCRENKINAAFAADRNMRCGLKSWCKACTNEASMKRRERNKAIADAGVVASFESTYEREVIAEPEELSLSAWIKGWFYGF